MSRYVTEESKTAPGSYHVLDTQKKRYVLMDAQQRIADKKTNELNAAAAKRPPNKMQVVREALGDPEPTLAELDDAETELARSDSVMALPTPGPSISPLALSHGDIDADAKDYHRERMLDDITRLVTAIPDADLREIASSTDTALVRIRVKQALLTSGNLLELDQPLTPLPPIKDKPPTALSEALMAMPSSGGYAPIDKKAYSIALRAFALAARAADDKLDELMELIERVAAGEMDTSGTAIILGDGAEAILMEAKDLTDAT